MINNLISDQMKKIWTNLELHFESYNFKNFRDFFRFLLNFFEFLINFSGFSGIKNRCFIFL